MTDRTYSVTTINNEYLSDSSSMAASVAAAWRRQGREPKAWVIQDDGTGGVCCLEIEITTVVGTRRAFESR